MNQSLKKGYSFLKSTDFLRAVVIGIAVATPIILGLYFGKLEAGLAICFGAFWSSPSNVRGSYRHRVNGIILSTLLVMFVAYVGNFLHLKIALAIPILGIMSFAIAYLSIYGFRASLISFSGLLALVLSLAHVNHSLQNWQYILLIGVGGMWYLLLVVIWLKLYPRAETEEELKKTFLLTADFLETRGKLVGPENERGKLQEKLQKIQTDLTGHHATLRELLMLSRRQSGKSNYEGRRLLVFVQLVEILETAIANPVNYDKMDKLFSMHSEFIESFRNILFEMADQLRLIAKTSDTPKRLPDSKKINQLFRNLETDIQKLDESPALDYEGFAMLQNLFKYQQTQNTKLKKIKWFLGTKDLGDQEFVDRNVSKLFIASTDYNPALLVRNFSFRNPIFRHSMRLAITLMVGYLIGLNFDSQTPYWILLSIIVIMRPTYGLTKSRLKDRILGTLIGGIAALGFVFLVHSPYLYAALGLVSLVIAFSMVQRNYRASAAFVTLSVVFIYAITRPNILGVIQYRIFDTAIGAALAYISMRWLLPAWEYTEINKNIRLSVSANKDFLDQIVNYYQKKGPVPIELKVSRKGAFLETSNLSAAFQRMTQEPLSKQKYPDKFYQLVELNYNFLSSLASLSSYIQLNTTTEPSDLFCTAVAKINKNLCEVLAGIENDGQMEPYSGYDDDSFFKERLSEVQVESPGLVLPDTMTKIQMYQEAHLMWEQLAWLFGLSADMLRLVTSMSFK